MTSDPTFCVNFNGISRVKPPSILMQLNPDTGKADHYLIEFRTDKSQEILRKQISRKPVFKYFFHFILASF
jgi:hypothetical protein